MERENSGNHLYIVLGKGSNGAGAVAVYERDAVRGKRIRSTEGSTVLRLSNDVEMTPGQVMQGLESKFGISSFRNGSFVLSYDLPAERMENIANYLRQEYKGKMAEWGISNN